jgi:hypothetical protein
MTLRGAAPTVVVAAVVLLAASACGTVDASNPPARHIDELDRLVHLAPQRPPRRTPSRPAKWGTRAPSHARLFKTFYRSAACEDSAAGD